ncbi:MAG: circularly permuted type 2 ATP-grasp protein [Betaproteobacteria bacterium]|nr:circularly permuted type 2 ATP-grasp protein [Rubrivivax sp.]
MSATLTPGQESLPFGGSDAAVGAAAHAFAAHALPPEPGVWDELRGEGGALRPAWQRFVAQVPAPAGGVSMAADLDRRVAQVEQRIRLDGVTHNVFAESGSGGVSARPWSLQLLPLIIEPADWAAIEAGVVQRAELLERMLADLYGPQTLLHEGLLPPALLLRHPGWLRPMIGVPPAGGQRLFIAAFDLARGPDGRWWLVAQRTQGPSGLGYVLHNRLVIARQFPEAFAALGVQRIASSYRLLLDALEQRAQQVAGHANPRVVLLTPGPYSETYFEHAYLARYLGLPLAEGGDLTVRGERLYLKTVEGLEPVHGVMRRLDDDWCDPLELRPDSALGVPGLLQAVRAGTVVLANALGSAFLETPAIQGFLPAIAERLLGQTLALPSLPTWWCGEAAAWSDVREQLADKVVRSTFPRGGRTSQAFNLGPSAAADAERSAVPVHEDPDAWTVQGRLRFARAPIWGDGAVTPRPAMVRVYAIADGREGRPRWHVLPGGMTRVARREDASISMQRGGTSLDTWVMTEGPVDAFSMLPQRLRVADLAAHQRPVSSRTGENLFWLGRYTERTEQLVRLARSTLMRIDADAEMDAPLRAALSQLAVGTGLAPAGVPTLSQSPRHFERAVLAALGDARGATSVAYNLLALERAAMALRERLAPEQWSLVRQMGEGFGSALETLHGELPLPAQVLPALDRLALQLAAATGAQTDRMTRDHGWRLLTVGRLLERLQGLALRLLAFLGPAEAQPPLGALAQMAGVELLLEQFDSLITFRARYQRHEDLLALTDVLVLDSTNPRAFAGVLRRLRTELGKLPGPAESHAPLLALLPPEGAGLSLEQLRALQDEPVAATAAALRSLSAGLLEAGHTLADRLGERYFTLAHGADQRIG